MEIETRLETTGMNILVVQKISKKLKSKRLKSRSKKFRTKRYTNQFLFRGCNPVFRDSEINRMEIGEPIETDSKIVIPVYITYKAAVQNITIKLKF